MKSFKKIRTGDYQIDQIQENLNQFFKQFSEIRFLNGILHENIRINTTYSLDHKLNRTAKGFIVTKRSANSVIWNGDIDDKTIALSSSADVTCDIWVF